MQLDTHTLFYYENANRVERIYIGFSFMEHGDA